MGNTVASSKKFVHSDNDYQLVIEASKELECLLELEFDAHGQGLHEKVSSIETAIPVPTIRSIRYVATLRNRLIHDREMRSLPDRQTFIKKFDDAMVELKIIIDKKRLDTGKVPATAAPGCVIS